MNARAILAALLIGTAAQVGLVIAGHYANGLYDPFYVGGVTISLAAGWIYGARAGQDWLRSLLGGAAAGGLCAFLGLALAVALKDDGPATLALEAGAATAAGLVGGAVGRLLSRGTITA